MKNILIIHPDGNINYNPNLTAMVNCLTEEDYTVDIISPKFSHLNQKSAIKNTHIILLESTKDFLDAYKNIPNNKYNHIIGIDQGIIAASKLSSKWHTSYSLISYEILFADEFPPLGKKEEIRSCSNISFAICQDSVRSLLLSQENHIPLNKIVNIPVADTYDGPYRKNNLLGKTLKIDSYKKIALYAGSLSSWSMTEKLIESTNLWPDDWVLVLHDRDGREAYLNPYLEKIKHNKKIYLSNISISIPSQLEKIISSADVGLAFYETNPNSPTLGKNLLFIGLSSGKIAMYLKYGLPVMINEIGEMSDYVRKYTCGMVVGDSKDINPAQIKNLSEISKNCTSFYKNKLDFSLYKNNFLKVIESAISGNDVNLPKLIDITSQSDYHPSVSMVNELKSLYHKYYIEYHKFQRLQNKYNNLINSFSNRLVYSILHPVTALKIFTRLIIKKLS